MPAMKAMPKGGRKPSQTLWAMVRKLSDEEWRMICSFSNVFGKGTLQLKLLSLLRSMEEYDAELEKSSFAGHNLKSLRSTTKFWLIRSASKLAFYQSKVTENVLDVDVLLNWGVHNDTLEFISEAKHLAKQQEEFVWLGLLYKQEIKALKVILNGPERAQKIETITLEAFENGKLVALGTEIELQIALYLEKGRSQILSSGHFDRALAEEYFQSEFFKQDIRNWPLSYQIQKLRIDESIHYYLGDTHNAIISAERIFALAKKLELLRKKKEELRLRCMFRLAAYYTELDQKNQVFEILDEFRRYSKIDSPFRETVLKRLTHTLLMTAFVHDRQDLAFEAISNWESNKYLFELDASDPMRFETLIYICTFLVSIGDFKSGRIVLNILLEKAELFSFFVLQTVLKISHLMILIDEEDEIGLTSYGKNYKRHLKAKLKDEFNSSIAYAGFEIIAILSKSSNLEGKDRLLISMKKLLPLLQTFEKSKEITLKPWLYAINRWAERKLE